MELKNEKKKANVKFNFLLQTEKESGFVPKERERERERRRTARTK